MKWLKSDGNTKELQIDNEIVVDMDLQGHSAGDLVNLMIYVQNDGVRNTVFTIRGVTDLGGGKFALDIGDTTLIRSYKNDNDFSQGFIYDIAGGAGFRIPLSYEWQVEIDKTAPISVASASPTTPNGSNGWYTSNVTVSITASDNASGIARTEYQVNNGDWITYNGSIPAFGDGIYKVSFRSTDRAGNVEELQTIEFKVKTNTVPNSSTDNGNYNPEPAVRHGQIVDESVLKLAQNGKVTVVMEKGNEELLIPINSAALLDNNKIDILADGVSIGIPTYWHN